MYLVRPPRDAALHELISRHPFAALEGDPADGLQFRRGDWHRAIAQGDPGENLYGLVELMDNNPLVCADSASVPSPAATLALIAAGPALRAGFPSGEIIFACPLPEPVDLTRALSDYGIGEWSWSSLGESNGTVDLISAMIPVPGNVDVREIDALYQEAYSRSFYVRLGQPGDPWSPDDVRNRPFAKLHLRLTMGEDGGLLNAVAMADRNGKLGAAQLVHAFNVMCGFEESSGIPENLEP
jgi:N-acetyl-gamma-glutamylphosphate reductase